MIDRKKMPPIVDAVHYQLELKPCAHHQLDNGVDVYMIDAGAELVRLTTQGSREVKSLWKIREILHQRGYRVPLVADIHFRPALALEASQVVEKIRINPGNSESLRRHG